jgi:predicted esterase
MNAQLLGLLTLLATRRHVAAYVGLNGWLPSAAQIASKASSPNPETLDYFLGDILDIHPHEIPLFQATEIAIFLAHTTDDEVIDVELGRQARDVLVHSLRYKRLVWHEEQEGGHLGMLTTKGLDWIGGCLKSIVEGDDNEMDCT